MFITKKLEKKYCKNNIKSDTIRSDTIKSDTRIKSHNRNKYTKNNNKKNNKGFYFLLDAIFAAILLVTGLLVISEVYTYKSSTQNIDFLSKDVLLILTTLKVSDFNETHLNNSFVVSEILNGNMTDTNSILEQAGEYWALNETSKASQLLSIVFNHSPIDFNVEILALNAYRTDVDTLFEYKYSDTRDEVVSSRRMVSGIEKGQPLEGSTSSAYLRKIKDKRNFAYAYFGGFVGQGNIAFFMDSFPADFNSSRINGIYLEGAFGNNFTLKINNQICNSTTTSQLFASTVYVGYWNITRCKNSMINGRNNFSITFSGFDFNYSYISGGYMRIDYSSDQLDTGQVSGFKRYFFPGIYGVANLYDSFYVPGELTNMEVMLHYNTTYSTYVTIGDRIIDLGNTSGEKYVLLNDSYLKNDLYFDYSKLSNKTVPIRFASYTEEFLEVIKGDADIVLITDFSGSMKKAVADWTQGNLGASCNEVFSDSTTRRTNLAQCVDEEFISMMMNYSGNRIWPVFIYKDKIQYYNNPTNELALTGYINSYTNGDGKTCLACAVNLAYDIFKNFSDPGKKKFIILMTDGIPTHCASGSCTSTSYTFGTKYCEGLCDTNGACEDVNVPGQCSECTTNNGPVLNLNFSAQRVVDDYDVTIFTVGFGPVDDCPLTEMVLEDVAIIGNGTYQQSSNSSVIRAIYQNISEEIMLRVTQENQSITIPSNVTISTLYEDSYINFTYIPIIEETQPQKISVTIQKPLDNCTSTINIPQGLIVVDSKVTVYSDIHWSDTLVVNGTTVFNLSEFYMPYHKLGDPFIIYAPSNLLSPGDNQIFIETGDSPTNRTGCFSNNSFIYTALITLGTERTSIKPKNEGCTWTVSFENEPDAIITVPSYYVGTKTCSYRPGDISYDADDSYDNAVYSLFRQLDFDDNGELYVNIGSEDLEVVITTVGSVPYMWGPSIIEARVWR